MRKTNIAQRFEDLKSAKLWATQQALSGSHANVLVTNHNYGGQTTGSTGLFISEAPGLSTVISNIGKTELAIVCSGSADNASTNGKTYTLTYKDSDGVTHVAVATGTATLNGTPVAFSPAIADFYCAISFEASAADANVNVVANVAGGSTYATISITATAATAAQLFGVGSVYIRSKTDNATHRGKATTLWYCTPWGELKYATGTTDAADSTTEVIFTDVNGTTDEIICDFYRVVTWTTVAITYQAGDFVMITDANCGNVNGSSGDIYAVHGSIAGGTVLQMEAVNFFAMSNDYRRSVLCDLQFSNGTLNQYVVWLKYTPKGESEVNVHFGVGSAGLKLDIFEELEECTDVLVAIYDTGEAGTVFCSMNVIESRIALCDSES